MGDYGERSNKIRKYHQSQNIHDQIDDRQVKTIKFLNGYADILLNRRNFQLYEPNNLKYDNKLLRSPLWHQVIINHEGKINKIQILNALNSITSAAMFIPIAYSNSKRSDTFMVKNQPDALKLLFDHALILSIDQFNYDLTVKLGVAEPNQHDINVIHQLEMVIEKFLSKMQNGRLDMSCYDKCKEMNNLDFSLQNEANFDFFCKCIVDKLRDRELKMLILCNHSIKYLSSLARFKNHPSLITISLKNNQISSITEFEHLKCLNLQSLNVIKNPATEGDAISINEQLMVILPTLKQTDLSRVEQRLLVEPVPYSNEEIIRANDINPQFKALFPRRETVKNYWNQVVIEHNGRFDGRKILDEMFLYFFNDTPFYPYFYESGEMEDSFMLHMNFEPLNTLVVNDLKMKMSDQEEVTFRLHLKCSTFPQNQEKWMDLIPRIVTKRITSTKLNLKDFKNDPELRNLTVNLSTNYGLRYVLTCALNQCDHIMEIDLSHNKLCAIKGLDVLIHQFSKLVALDLSHNNIQSIKEFPKNLKLKEVTMDHNPMFDKFSEKMYMQQAWKYVKDFSNVCPDLQFIDGRRIQKFNKDLPHIPFQNFCVQPKAYMAIDNFVSYFFKTFGDLQLRNNLANMYNKMSQLTISTEESEKQQFLGQVEIVDFFSTLPAIEHDYVTLSVDIPLFYFRAYPEIIQIVANGVFRLTREKEKLFKFQRNFILKKEQRSNGRARGTLSNTFYFEIINDIFQYEIVTDEKIKNKAFKRKQATISEVEHAFSNDTMERKFQENLKMLEQTIMMKPEWCKRFLEEANGDFRVALDYFLKFYERNLLRNEDFSFK